MELADLEKVPSPSRDAEDPHAAPVAAAAAEEAATPAAATPTAEEAAETPMPNLSAAAAHIARPSHH
jgi:hypothetical protein